jgi:hypothetical protein
MTDGELAIPNSGPTGRRQSEWSAAARRHSALGPPGGADLSEAQLQGSRGRPVRCEARTSRVHGALLQGAELQGASLKGGFFGLREGFRRSI